MARRSLFGLAQKAWRRLLGKRSTVKNRPQSPPIPPPVQQQRRSYPPTPPGGVQPPPVIPRNRPTIADPTADQPQQIAPPQRPQPQEPTPQEVRDIQEVEEVYDQIQLLGRDRGFSDEMQAVMDQMRTVSSSNVYGYFYELETQRSGILYVTFLADAAPGQKRPNRPGSTYAYFDVPAAKFKQFQSASDSSAGKAVWDYLRVRGTSWEHQHRYRFIQSAGDYIPRRATRGGFKTRNVAPVGQPKIPNRTWSAISRLKGSKSKEIRNYAEKLRQALLKESGFKRSTLPARSFVTNRGGQPGRGSPNRGGPNRGSPNRG